MSKVLGMVVVGLGLAGCTVAPPAATQPDMEMPRPAFFRFEIEGNDGAAAWQTGFIDVGVDDTFSCRLTFDPPFGPKPPPHVIDGGLAPGLFDAITALMDAEEFGPEFDDDTDAFGVRISVTLSDWTESPLGQLVEGKIDQALAPTVCLPFG